MAAPNAVGEQGGAVAPPPGPVNVTVDSRNLKTSPFVLQSDPLANGKAWEEWIEGLEREFRYFRIQDPQDRKDALIIFGGRDLARLERSLPDPPEREGEAPDAYVKLKQKLDEHFLPQKNKHHARYVFSKIRPNSGESTAVYAARLREKATECDFGDSMEERILEHLIQTVQNETLVKKAISKRWALDRFIQEASQTEDINAQMAEMKTVAKLKVKQHPSKPQQDRNKRTFHKDQKPRKDDARKKTNPHSAKPVGKACTYCGLTGKHPPGRNCPAYGKECKKCGRMNHFAQACTASSTSMSTDDSKKKKYVKKTDLEDEESDSEYLVHHLRVKKVNSTRIAESECSVKVRVADIDIWAEADSGAQVNIMDQYQYKALEHRTEENIPLEESNVKLKTVKDPLEVKGQFTTIVRNQTRGVPATFIVVKGHIDSKPLLSKKTLTDLGMLKIQPDGSLAEPNRLKIEEQIKQVKKLETIEDITKQYPKVFKGVGCIRDKKNNKDLFGRFNMKADAQPVAQKPRPVPYYLEEPLRKLIQQGIEEDLFERVEEGEPITWCSPLVVQPKPRFKKEKEKGKLEPHMIRASVDLRVPNSNMERSRITQPPLLEDFIHKFHNCTVWSKLDLRQGYNQLILDPESREIATFSTPWGNVRPKRLVFGAKASQDIFDEAMFRIFGDIPRCMNQRDDILIGGRDVMEHNETVRKVLQKAEDFGITFNEEKCLFAQEEIEFYGYLFTKDGLKPTPSKVEAIRRCKRPESKTAVRSFLGMTGYLSKFIPRYASITAPLRQLTHKDQKFQWGKREEETFQKVKDSIACDDIMTYFNPTRPIQVRVEASFNEGLSAGLFQKTTKGWQPVHFISRTMTDTEKRYSQTEKDALAVKWAKNRFRIYLHGAPKFKIITAHKPLIPLFNKPTAKLPPRIERWVMDMQDVDYEMVYEPGKDEADPLDFLSRHPLPETEDDCTEQMIKRTITEEHAIVLEQIQKHTEEDPAMQKLKDRILKGDWEGWKKDPDIAPFIAIHQELYIAEDLIFRMHQIVLPKNLHRKAVKAAHKLGHFGTSRTKQMLRERYWFPGMSQTISEIIDQCFDCKISNKQHREEPVKIMKIPEKPWETISVDFGGPYPDGHYNLVVIDKRTRYPEVETVYSTAFKPTKEKLQKIFATHGTPRRLESDNGPPFNSRDFEEWADVEGFQHHRVTPEHPRANGEAESFMKLLNKQEQIAHCQGRDRKSVICEMLIGYRSTPHPATGIPPYEALMNRKVRTKLDHTNTEEVTVNQEAINVNDHSYKIKSKQQRENRFTRPHQFIAGDYVLLKQKKQNKYSTPFEPNFYIVFKVDGSRIGARRWRDGREVYRDASQFKLANAAIELEDTRSKEEDVAMDREELLMMARPERDTCLHVPMTPCQTRDTVAVDQETQSPSTDTQKSPHTGTSMQLSPVHSPGVHDPRMHSPRVQNTRTPKESTQTERPRRSRQIPRYLMDYVQ